MGKLKKLPPKLRMVRVSVNTQIKFYPKIPELVLEDCSLFTRLPATWRCLVSQAGS